MNPLGGIENRPIEEDQMNIARNFNSRGNVGRTRQYPPSFVKGRLTMESLICSNRASNSLTVLVQIDDVTVHKESVRT